MSIAAMARGGGGGGCGTSDDPARGRFGVVARSLLGVHGPLLQTGNN